MQRARVCALLLTFSVSFFGAHSADLKCLDIQPIMSGYLDCSILDRPCSYSKANIGGLWWNYGPDRTYKNRDCDKCHLNYGGSDCKDNSCPHMSGPAGTAIDLLPADSESWICPGFCASMPQVPIKMSLVKYVSTWECKGHWIAGGCTIHNTRVDTQPAVVNQLPMSTPLKLLYSDVLPISECKTKRYEDNFNARVGACRQWSSFGHMPQMTHLDAFWTDGAARAYTFDGVKQKTQAISQCRTINNVDSYLFYSKPCWEDTVAAEQKKKQFSIKPYYTYYRGKESKSQVHDCRMRVVGSNNEQSNKWDDSALQPPSSTEWNINSHWSHPPTHSKHFYNFKTVFDVMQGTFGAFSNREDKTIATWDFTIPCVDQDNKQQRSNKVYYAESGCNQQTCVDFITKPCYDNIYRFDEMVCTFIERIGSNPIKFSNFKDKIIDSSDQKEPFMSYGNSHFEIWYDTAKVQVKKDSTITVIPNQPTVFTDDNTISVSLIRDASNVYSCRRCYDPDMPLHGRKYLVDAMGNDIISCRPCLNYEKVTITSTGMNYQDCVVCDPHKVRNQADARECMKCQDIDPLKPMRRKRTDTTGHTVCTACQHFQYFRGDSDEGCIFLQTVTDNIKVAVLSGNKKAVLYGEDWYITDNIPTQIEEKFWRDKILPDSNWSTPFVPKACPPAYDIPTGNVPRLKFTAWCGHREMKRHHQAWVRVNESSLYVPLNSDVARTRINTSVVELCGTNALTQVSGNTTFDLACGSHKFSLVREGFQDKCMQCDGAQYTDKCWPTYVDGLELNDNTYFGNDALTPQPGTCENCNPRCHDTLQPDSYIDPIQYSCWWNGTGRIPGRLGATATTFAWYKPAPCTKCGNVRLTADVARIVLRCGNRFSYRRWVPDSVSSSADNPDISIPSSRICCVEALASGKLCTDTPAEFETFAQLNCKKTVDDAPPEFLPYCPLGWYVERTCAKDSPAWNPDCCVKCKACSGGLFKLDTYKVCPGDELFDSQDRGCTTKCLTNQYNRNDQCIKCEACE